jgi:hypothetical protein
MCQSFCAAEISEDRIGSKRIIDDHEVDELSPDESSHICAPSQVPVRSTSEPSWGRALDSKAKEPSML